MNQTVINMEHRRLGWPWAPDVSWAVVCLMLAVLLALAWANVPA